MKKVRIITIVDPNPNYGNRLQNYATQCVLNRMGYSVETVSFEKPLYSKRFLMRKWVHMFTKYKLTNNSFFWKYGTVKYKNFQFFNKKYLNLYHSRNIKKISIGADYFVVGSDQVWNPQWYDSDDLKREVFLLTFTESEKKVCFSPSFGVEKLPSEWKEYFKKYLSDIKNISVREEAGAKIVKELTGKDASVLIDPTLMLSKEEWLEIAEMPENIDCDDKYILTYFLGEKSDRVKEKINDLQEQGYTVYNLNDKSRPEVYVLNPSNFVYMFANAKLILTDSFHACVFSFIFDKPFLVYNRKGLYANMMSRMETLLEKFDIERKYIDSGLENDLFESNYENGKRQLKIEQKKVYDFLKMSFDK